MFAAWLQPSVKNGGAILLPHYSVELSQLETEHRHECARLIEAAAPHPDAAAGDYRYVLLAADAIGHGRSRDRRAEVEAVYLLEGFGVIDCEFPGHVSGEQKPAVGTEHARLGWRLERRLVDDFAG